MRLKAVCASMCLIAACGGKGRSVDTSSQGAAKPESSAEASRNEPTTAPNEKPPMALTLRVRRAGEGLGLSLVNDGPASVRLAREVILDEARGTAFQPVDVSALELSLDCRSRGCITLAPGAELLAPNWLDTVGAERCGALLTPTARGSYRLRVTSCAKDAEAEVRFTWP